MTSRRFDAITTLTFDIFGTALDLTGSLEGPTGLFLEGLGSDISGVEFYAQWRARQRIEQFQDSLMDLGHSGYLETCRRALVYTLRMNGIEYRNEQADELMKAWQGLSPHPDALEGLRRLKSRFRVVALSNGEADFLSHLARNRMRFEFDEIISVDEAGVFKPHPSVYRTAARILGSEPSEIMMVAAHSFDIMGAVACGYSGAFVNRYGLPYEDTTKYVPALVVDDFIELADALLGDSE